MALVNAHKPACFTGDVIEQFFGDVDGDAESREVRCKGAAEVVERPRGYRITKLLIKRSFGLGPAVERFCLRTPCWKQQLAGCSD